MPKGKGYSGKWLESQVYARRKAYPDGPPEARKEGPGYPGEKLGTPRYGKGAFPTNHDHAGRAPNVTGKPYRKKDPDLPSGEQTKAFPRNPGQFD